MALQLDRELTAEEDLSPARVDDPIHDKFYGPSSVHFDEYPPCIGTKDVGSGELPLELLSSKLVAEAAIQCRCSFPVIESQVPYLTAPLTIYFNLGQLEQAYFSAHQLDTDGVEQGFAKEMLSLFWKTANSAFLVIYWPAFMRDWVSSGPSSLLLLFPQVYSPRTVHYSNVSQKLCMLT